MNRFFDSIDFGKLAIYIWVGFTTLYFLVSVSIPFVIQKTQANLMQNAYNNGANQAANDILTKTFSGNVYQNGYNTAFVQLGQALGKQVSEGCKSPIPVNVGGTGALGIVSTDCIQPPQQAQSQSSQGVNPASPVR
jgi:hypothetical protein